VGDPAIDENANGARGLPLLPRPLVELAETATRAPLEPLPPESGVGRAIATYGLSVVVGFFGFAFSVTSTHTCGASRSVQLKKIAARAELERAAEEAERRPSP
jgi:hypothetical protein